MVPQLPDTGVICARCHEANIAKPKSFPQVITGEHSGGVVCKTCHTPHSPLIMPSKPTANSPATPQPGGQS